MFFTNGVLAVPGDDLKAVTVADEINEMHSFVNCLKIEYDVNHPGYVQLLSIGYLNFDFESSKYICLPLSHDQRRYRDNYITCTGLEDRISQNGPAFSFRNVLPVSAGSGELFNVGDEGMKIDVVDSVHCLSWPPADVCDWVSRKRPHGWPDAKLGR